MSYSGRRKYVYVSQCCKCGFFLRGRPEDSDIEECPECGCPEWDVEYDGGDTWGDEEYHAAVDEGVNLRPRRLQ